MLESTVTDAVTQALRQVQELGGYEWVDLAPGAKVIGCLEGFDSLTGIEATVLVEQNVASALGLDAVSLGKDSIFVSDDGRKALSLKQVIAKVCSAVEGSE